MILKDYWRVDRDIAAGKIADYLEMPYNQRRYVEDALLKNGYIVVKPIKKEKSKPIIRLTMPLFFMYGLILIVFIPIKYLATGDGMYSDKEIFGRIYKKWSNALNW